MARRDWSGWRQVMIVAPRWCRQAPWKSLDNRVELANLCVEQAPACWCECSDQPGGAPAGLQPAVAATNMPPSPLQPVECHPELPGTQKDVEFRQRKSKTAAKHETWAYKGGLRRSGTRNASASTGRIVKRPTHAALSHNSHISAPRIHEQRSIWAMCSKHCDFNALGF